MSTTSDTLARPDLDLIIIGGSAAGMSAAVYAARRRLNFKIIAGDVGGEMVLSGEIENWPAVVHTTGIELTERFREQMKAHDIAIEEGLVVTAIEKPDEYFTIRMRRNGHAAAMETVQEHQDTTRETMTMRARTIIVATGVHPRELGVPGEKELRGKGVTYCTVCDGPLFPKKMVATIGGGNSALESAIMMAGIASKVYVINKNAQFKGDAVLIDKVANELSKQNVEVVYNALTKSISGNGFVSGLEYEDTVTHEMRHLAVEGIFVHIGMIPNSTFLPTEIEKNAFGEIIVDAASRTNVPGLFAAGDVTAIAYKQLAIAAGQGVAAALSAVEYLNKQR